MSEERDVGSFVRRRRQVEEEVVVAEHVRSTRVVSVKFVDHPDQPRPVTTWQDHLIYTSHAPPRIQCPTNANRGPWQLLCARAPLLTRDNDLSQPATRVDTTAGNYFVPLSIRPIIICVVAEVMSNYLTTDGLKNNLYIRRPPEA